jgi:hypothetical protein
MILRSLLVLVLLAQAAHADKPRVLVLPIAAGQSVDTGAASAFDARLLVALEDTRRVTTVTLDEELECTTAKCLAEAATEAQAQSALSLTLVREAEGLTLFATLLDARTSQTSRRVELTPLSASELAASAPVELAQRLFGAAPGPAVVGIVERGQASGAAEAISSRLAALRTFTVVAAARSGVTLTHRAEVNVTEFSIVRRRHHLRHYLDGVLSATLTIVDIGRNRVVFTKPVKVTVSRRDRKSSTAEVSALLAEAAASDWMTAFLAAQTENQLKGDVK